MAQCRRSWNRNPGKTAFFVSILQPVRQLFTCFSLDCASLRSLFASAVSANERRDGLPYVQPSNSSDRGVSEEMVRCSADKCEVPSLVEHEHRRRSSCHST